MKKQFFRPYGPAFWIGIIWIAVSLAVLHVYLSEPLWYDKLHYESKDTIVFCGQLLFGFGLILTVITLPTIPSKK